MAEPFKNLLGPAVVDELGHHLQRVDRRFDRARFERLALGGLGALELKARVRHLAAALAAVLPADFAAAAERLEACLAPARLDDDLGALRTSAAGLAGWAIWPLTEYVARHGLATPERALRALHALTQRSTAEFALRPFLLTHRAITFRTLQDWLVDPSPHVRRLVSEGSRPRLPWGEALPFLMEDPAPTLPLLAVLQHDPSAYVRRSVANHLNDIAKDHPGVVAAWLQRHLPDAGAELRALLRHASRTLIKRGDRAVLKAWGLGARFRGAASLRVTPNRVRIGEAVELQVTLTSAAAKAQRLVVDYAVHHVRADGSTAPKVRKGWQVELAPRAARDLRKRHSLRVVSTRNYHPGTHAIDLLVNGVAVAKAAFELTAARR